MPLSAINAGVVDHVLGSNAIGQAIGRLARFPESFARGADSVRDFPPAALQKIFNVLLVAKNVDFSDYKPTTIRRRILRRMAIRHVHQMEDYGVLVQTEAEEADRLFHDLLINVTGFFRDAQVFRALEKQILPRLIAEKGGAGELRAWVPGCATGQEVYSVAICVVETLARLKATMSVQIFGTDVSETAIAQARLGLYPAASVRDMPAGLKKRYFSRKNGSVQIDRSIRDLCTFARQNLATDPPFSRLDLVSCRNVLIYFGPNLQRKCLPLFYYALNPMDSLSSADRRPLETSPTSFPSWTRKTRSIARR